MEDFDEPIESVSESGTGGKAGLFGVVIGIAGIIVGTTGIFMANQAQTKVREMEARLAATPDQVPELKQSIGSLDERLVKLGTEFVKLGRQDRQLQENTQAAFDSVTRDVRANREGLNQLTEKLSELVTQIEKPRVSAPQPVPMEQASDTGTQEVAGDESLAAQGIYTIKSGDTLSKVAKAYGISLNKLLQANPSLNPRALQIGQKIVIPEP